MNPRNPTNSSSSDDPGTDLEVPGGIYLCQVSDTISCGACCGLYNLADLSRPQLMAGLKRRSQAFARVCRSADALVAFAEAQTARLARPQPYAGFHHCPFIGLIGERCQRVGCLLHPLSPDNQGVDFRGLSYYGGMACRIYFCLSTRRLAARIKTIVRAAATDWYTYGLIITERELLEAIFAEIEKRAGRILRPEEVTADPRAMDLFRQVLELKFTWPFRPARESLCNYFFEDRQYRRPPVDYRRSGGGPSRYDAIHRELGSFFDSSESLSAADQRLDDLFERWETL
jgi:hypothetical protein